MKNLSFSNNNPSYSSRDFLRFLKKILSAEKNLYGLLVIYGIGISILSLSIPIAVQYTIGSVTFTGLLKPLTVIVIILFIILVFYAILKSLQIYVIHIFSKHFFTRIVGDMFNSFVLSDYESFERRNNTDIANRFFEVFNIQNVFPSILFGGVSIVQQIIVGFLLISFYHVSFLMFSLVIVFLSYFIVKLKSFSALNNFNKTSNNKYEVIDLLENISRMQKEFKSEHAIEYAKSKVNLGVENFLHNRDRYFSDLLSQSMSFLALYIFASCGFLFIGSILVLEGEITIGQLVAMELIVSAALLRLSEFGRYLDNFYELCVACGKINIFYNIKPEKNSGNLLTSQIKKSDEIISMDNVRLDYQDQSFCLNFSTKTSTSNLIAVANNNSRDIFCKLILRFIEPQAGEIKYHNQNIENINPYSLRDRISLIDSTEIYQCSILEYLTNGIEFSKSDIQKALGAVQLDTVIKSLNIDLNHQIIPCGYPFSPTQIIRLKIAKALLYKPDIIILGTTFDHIEHSRKQFILNSIKELYPDSTLIHFTNAIARDYDFTYDSYFFIGTSSMESFKTLKEFNDFEYEFFIESAK